MHCFIIAEAGVNHNGKLDYALALVDAAAAAGADAVKFQTFTAENVVSPFAEKAEYQKRTTGAGTQFEMIKALELSEADHRVIHQHCAAVGIEFMSATGAPEMVDFLVDLGLKRLKVASGEINNFPLLIHLATKNLPIILSTGMATLEEIHEAIKVIAATRLTYGFNEPLEERLTILHCTSNYPAPFKEVNLRAMQTIANSCHLPVGYSDHTEGILVAPIAVAMGASVIEKHFTLDKKLPGPDHEASIDPHELKQLVKNIRVAEEMLGDGRKQPVASELAVKDVVRRSVTLRRALAKGSQIAMEDVALLRPGTGIPPAELVNIVGKTLNQALEAGSTLQWHHLEPTNA